MNLYHSRDKFGRRQTDAMLFLFFLGKGFDIPEESKLIKLYHYQVASVAQLDAPSDWRPGGRGFNPLRGRQHSFVEIDHKNIFYVLSFSPFR